MVDSESDLLGNSAHSVAEMIAQGHLTATALLELTLARIAKRGHLTNAFLTVIEESAQAAARIADDELKHGRRRSPLHGLPVVVKDLFETNGVRTTAGSRVLERWIPDRDATVVRLLRDAGLVIVAKTGLSEFACCPFSANPHYGPVRNPWDLQYDALGSSGGTAAAIADCTAFGGIGSDTGGSIRLPAAACGLVGLKPTYGLVSLTGVVPLCIGEDHVGPMARTVRDTALLLDIMSGYDPSDLNSSEGSSGLVASLLSHGVDGLKVAYLVDDGGGPVHPEVRAAAERGGELLTLGGARVDPIALPSLSDFPHVGRPIWEAEAASAHGHLLLDHRSELGPHFASFVERGMSRSGTEVVGAREALKRLLRQVAVALEGFDLLIGPVLSSFPPLAGEAPTGLVRFTAPWNFAGWPAASVPVAQPAGGLPIGVQIVGRPWREDLVLRAAAIIERGFALLFPPPSNEDYPVR